MQQSFDRPQTAASDSEACNICGASTYGPGPNGRLSRGGHTPRCQKCGSLERHRRLRRAYATLPEAWLASLSVLQLSPDIGVDPAWFRHYEISEYGGDNSLNLEAIARADNSYDLIICNHVLEHVANDRQGFRELLRVARSLVQITLPSPYTRATTLDWGYPKPEAYGHYRGYGRDVVGIFLEAEPETHVCRLEVEDPVTREADYIYLCAKDLALLRRLSARYTLSEFHSGPRANTTS